MMTDTNEKLYSRNFDYLKALLEKGMYLKNGVDGGSMVFNPETRESMTISAYAYYRCLDSDIYLVNVDDKNRKHLSIENIVSELSLL